MHSLIFFGSDQYSAVVLRQLISAPNCEIKALITDYPKLIGKDKSTTPSHTEIIAKTHNLKICYYPSNQDEMSIFVDTLKSTGKATGICASFDHLLPQEIIKVFDGNLYHLHPSLLPQYRNVSPVQYAIALGDKETGITLFRISEGIDNGEIIAQASEPILPTDTLVTLTPRLFMLGAQLFLSYDPCNPSNNYKDRNFANTAQPLIFTHRLTRDSGFIEWSVLYKLLENKTVSIEDTKNELLRLRLTHNPEGTILTDLLHALTPWPGIWSNILTNKGELRISLETIKPTITLKIAGKPNPITYPDFVKYYL